MIRRARIPLLGWALLFGLSLALFPSSLRAQDAAAPTKTKAVVAAARRSAQATMQTFLSAMNATPRDFAAAVACLDSTGWDADAWTVRGKELASTLKTVMDKIEAVDISSLPDDPEAPPFAWYESPIGNVTLAKMTEGDARGEWRFTSKTLHTLDALYRSFEDKGIAAELQAAGIQEQLTLAQRVQRRMPSWMKNQVLGLLAWQWIALVSLLPIGWLVMVIVAAMAVRALRIVLGRSGLALEDDARRRVARSFGAVVTVVLWYYAIQVLALPEALLGVLLQGTKLGLAITGVFLGYRTVDIIGGRIAANEEVRLTQFDDVLIPLLRTVLRLCVIVMVLLFVIQWMGKEWTAVLGALGVGGVALAFAAQDTIGNFFGSITVLFDRPFGIGDWIVVGDVEGTVERVGFRSTRVRTFYNSMVTIPNAKMVNMNVDNYGARRFRRARVMLSLTYDTSPEKIEAFCEGIRELIRLHPYTRKDYYHVYFNQFAASSLDVMLYCFFEVPDWGTELRERQNLFLDILRLAERIGVSFAFPTQTVWLEKATEDTRAVDRVSIKPGSRDADRIGLDHAAKLFEQTYGPSPAKPKPVVIDTKPRSRRSGS